MSRLEAAKQFVLESLAETAAAVSLVKLVEKAAADNGHFAATETRTAAAALEEEGIVRLTEDYYVALIS